MITVLSLKAQDVINKNNMPFYFDVVVLSIGEVKYVDYTQAGKKEQKYLVGLKNAAFVNLQDGAQVVKIVVAKAIENTDIGKLINLKIIPVVSQIKDTFGSAWGKAILPFNLIFNKN